jgi:hypothetical protein
MDRENDTSKLMAFFDGEPDAWAAAQVLKELGYTAEVHRCTEEPYAQTAREFFEGEIGDFEKNAIVVSDDADPEAFQSIMTRHGGRVAQGI